MDDVTPQPSTLPRIPASRSTSTSEQPAISVSYFRCIELYQNLLHLLSSESCHVVCFEQVNVDKVLEEYGRFRIWGEQTRAALPETARGSLDDTIRKDDSLKGTLNGILGQLYQLLTMAIPIAGRKTDDTTHDSESSISADSDFDSDSQLGFVKDSERNSHVPDHQPSRVSKISIVMKHAFEQIRLLYHMSILLNRPGLSGRYLRSTNKNENNLILSHFCEFDYRHIREKLQQWKGELKVILDEDGEKEPVTTEEDMKERKKYVLSLSDETEILCRRLAISNTKRRDQLQYWAHNPNRPDGGDAQTSIYVQAKAKTTTTKRQTSTVKPVKQDKVTGSYASKSITSKQSFSTVAVSDIFDHQTNLRPRTIYAETTAGNKTSNRVPDVPKAAKMDSTFKCPYCNLILNSGFMDNRLNWKRHVFSDLRPYVCTFSECLNPQKQYHTRHDWIYHEQQMHRRQWVCSGDCNQRFPTKDLMVDHLRNVHPDSLTQHQLPIVIEMSERPIDEDEILPCPLCPSKLYLSKLQHHVADHLERISLFVLPIGGNENEDMNLDEVAGISSKLDQNQGSVATEASLSSLEFSETNDKGQSDEDFSKLLLMEETDIKLKCEDWALLQKEVLRLPPPKEINPLKFREVLNRGRGAYDTTGVEKPPKPKPK